MAFKNIAVAAGLSLGIAAGLVAAQEKAAPKPLVHRDLLVLGSRAIAPPVRDIFRPKTAAVPPDARQVGGAVARPASKSPAPEAQPSFALNISYIGSIRSGGRTIALVLRAGQTVSVGEGDELAPGYKVVAVTAEAIIVQGPTGERRTFARQGERP
jgi:hypothetical protein